MILTNLTSRQKSKLEDILYEIENLMDDLYPDRNFLIPAKEDLIEFIEGFDLTPEELIYD